MDQNLKIHIEQRELSSLRQLSKNAHYLDKDEYDTLVSNLRRDGCLTSLPVIYDHDTPGEILSGNHRVKAAIAAGITHADVIVIDTELSQDQKTGVILSHNSIKGKDDPNILKDLYDSIISLDYKSYSGLTDDDFKVPELDLVPLSFKQETSKDVVIAFMKADLAVFEDNVERIHKLCANKSVYTADLKVFDDLHHAIFKTRQGLNIINISLALRAMSELALKQLEMETESAS